MCKMLMWEDGFCRGRVAECLDEMEGETTECEPNISNYWQSSFDVTIAVIQAGHGLFQLEPKAVEDFTSARQNDFLSLIVSGDKDKNQVSDSEAANMLKTSNETFIW
ncbi:hypothetical protein ACS0TY_013101 [Phlomoides rotata]